MQTYQIGANQAGQRLDKFLHKFMPTAGNSFIYKMLRKKNIVLNGKKAEGKEILTVGDTVSFFFSDETFQLFTGRTASCSTTNNPTFSRPGPTNEISGKCEEYRIAYKQLAGITVIYEDSNILILNKPAGVLTQKADSKQISLNEWMIGYLLAEKRISEETLMTFKPSVQNRLDRNTSGLVLCGISLPGSQMLSRLIHNRSIGKYYITIVKGHVKEAGEIDGFLIKDEITNKVSITVQEGCAIKTAFRPLSYGKDCTCLEVELITGKTHQIRAHLASIGHPILGDIKYGEQTGKWNEEYRRACHIKHQLLHAYRVEFPVMEEPFLNLSKCTFKAPLPKIFEEVFTYGNMEFPRT